MGLYLLQFGFPVGLHVWSRVWPDAAQHFESNVSDLSFWT